MRRRSHTATTVHSTIHNGVEIVYNMAKDHWQFTLRGQDRHTKSLGEAIKQIEKPAPKGGKPFERIEVFRTGDNWRNGPEKFVKVTVTSIVDDQYAHDVWITDRGSRTKVGANSCYLITNKNKSLMKSISDLSSKIRTLEKMKDQMFDNLEKLHIEKEDE